MEATHARCGGRWISTDDGATVCDGCGAVLHPLAPVPQDATQA